MCQSPVLVTNPIPSYQSPATSLNRWTFISLTPVLVVEEGSGDGTTDVLARVSSTESSVIVMSSWLQFDLFKIWQFSISTETKDTREKREKKRIVKKYIYWLKWIFDQCSATIVPKHHLPSFLLAYRIRASNTINLHWNSVSKIDRFKHWVTCNLPREHNHKFE